MGQQFFALFRFLTNDEPVDLKFVLQTSPAYVNK